MLFELKINFEQFSSYNNYKIIVVFFSNGTCYEFFSFSITLKISP